VKLAVYREGQLIGEHDLLSILGGNLESESFEISIGRAEDCHIRIEDPQISRLHAIIKKTGAAWEIIKKTSNGTFVVNGSPIENKVLMNGDMILLGPFQMNIIMTEAIAVAPAAVTEIVKEPEAPQEESLEQAQPESNTDILNMMVEEQEAQLDVLDESEAEFSDATVSPEEESTEAFIDTNEDAGEGEFSSEEEGFGEEGFSEGEEGFAEGEDGFSEDGFGEEGFGEDGVEMEEVEDKTSFIQSFASFELFLFGEHAPYDRYKLDEKEVFIGRDLKKCQIILSDPEVSGTHAVIRRGVLGYTLEDLNSSNGTIYQGARINQIQLEEGAEFMIGSTTFTVKVSSEMLDVEAHNLMPVADNQEIEIEEVVEEEVDLGDLTEEEALALTGGGATEEKPKSLIGKFKALPPRKRLIYGLVVLAGLYMLMDGGDEQPKKQAPANAKTEVSKDKKDDSKQDATKKTKKILTPEEQKQLDELYLLAKSLVDSGKYEEALFEFDKIVKIDDEYKQTQLLKSLAEEGLKKLEDLARKEQERKEAEERRKQVKELVDRAKAATDKRQVSVAETLFTQIYALDPENLDVSQMKLELEAWKREEEKKKMEKEREAAEKKRQIELLAPGKNHYLKEEWFKAINRLEEYLQRTDLQEDYIKEATKMLQESKEKLKRKVSPLLGKARSAKEAQDLKASYEIYKLILKIDPTSSEALNEMSEIQDILYRRSMKKYREALISESLSLFEEAKEKFQEVQQISPSDSEYYKKASEKLKNYWD